MTDYNSDVSSPPRYYDQYYRLNSVPEALFLIEAECLDTPIDTTTDTKTRQKGIIYGGGILSILLIVGGFQLARWQNVTPANPPIGTSEVEIVIAP